MRDFTEIWSYLARDPLVWLTLTLAAYALADVFAAWTNRAPWANPMALAVAMIAVMLWASDTSYEAYFEGAQFVHFMLGPATVALAVPLVAARDQVRRTLLPLAVSLVAGSVTALGSAVAIGWAMGLSRETLLSLVPKSTTAPVALGIAESTGGSPTLTATLVILTGMVGAIVVTPLMNATGIRDFRARGFAAGVAAHGLGTARAFQVDETAGAFAGIGMGLNAILTAIIAPIAVALLF